MAFKFAFKRNPSAKPMSVVRTGTVAQQLVGSRSLVRKMQLLGVIFVVALGLLIAVALSAVRDATSVSAQLYGVAKLRLMVQQVASTTLNALSGNTAAFTALTNLGERGETLIENIDKGGEVDGLTLRPASDSERVPLNTVRTEWARINNNIKELNKEWESIVTAAAKNNNPGKNMFELISASPWSEKLIYQHSDFMVATDTLNKSLDAKLDRGGKNILLVAALGAISLTLLVLMARIYVTDAATRRRAIEEQMRTAEIAKERTQEAILRLMNEMGGLADGDLRVRATVSEDITGAIADSVNYTVEELAVLVKRMNEAATRMTATTQSAHDTSVELLAASQRQSGEIESAVQQVLAMAASMNDVSGRATESTNVALRSLEAAGKGATAVQNSILGMNEIRGQIQETSKRIKRLGESSQEISEIVELISVITEQTNVLALNAAIQAASAGEAGRGFSVVAEEVQRLAERSAEATKQIAAIVKAIQADTHDAVAAMATTTQGVVAGGKLSDAAGQALDEISSVSQNLAQLIESIATSTQQQANIATQVASRMQGIRQITEQTTIGTQKTTGSVGELAAIAVDLKGSVSGFKI